MLGRNEKNNRDITIIGGGPSGMIAAISAARIAGGCKVNLLEKNPSLGRKLLATGNGRCNFSNSHCSYEDFKDFSKDTFQGFGVEETLAFFEGLGVYWREEPEGRLYPYSEQASAIQEALLYELEALGVNIIHSFHVASVGKLDYNAKDNMCNKYEGYQFEITHENGSKIKTNKIIIATGGKAGSQFGSVGEGYNFAKSFGHTTVKPVPALVQISCENKGFNALKGVRAKARVGLKYKNKVLLEESGDLQFTEDGVSGICIFNLSRYIKIGDIRQGFKDYSVLVDFFPEISEEELFKMLMQRKKDLGSRDKRDFLLGALNKKLGPLLLEEADICLNGKIKDLLDKELDKLSKLLKNWELKISATKGWKEAQVTSGGIRTEEIDGTTMESKLLPGIFFAGEVVDIDGKCGGYNLQWAWTSGFVAGKFAAMDIRSVDVKNT